MKGDNFESTLIDKGHCVLLNKFYDSQLKKRVESLANLRANNHDCNMTEPLRGKITWPKALVMIII